MDFAARGAGVPIVDRGVELNPGIGAGPGCEAYLFPKLARLQSTGDGAVFPEGEIPFAVDFDGLEEGVGNPHRIIGVLASDRAIGL